ncbi:hypothetical protein FJ250_06365 [bacterium]|nr:hypothetical protein [bacterium]
MAPLQSGLAVRVTTAPPVRVPYALAAFGAEPAGGAVRLAWRPADERPVLGWHVERVDAAGARRLTTEPLPADARAFTDTEPSSDPAARYALVALHPWQSESRPGEVAVGGQGGARFFLRTVGANPAREGVELAFALPQGGHARLRVFDVAGRVVRTLADGPLAGGEGRQTWDGRDDDGRPLGGGLYFGRLESAAGVATAKLTLVR